jgi:hypothetical protein
VAHVRENVVALPLTLTPEELQTLDAAHPEAFIRTAKSGATLRAKDRCETCGSRQQLELHHVGHRRDASLFNCLVLCARCHRAERARRRNACSGRT